MDLPAFLQRAFGARPQPDGDPRRAAPRVRIGPLHSIAFTWHAAGGEVQVPVANQLATTLRFVSSIPGLDPGHRDAILALIC